MIKPALFADDGEVPGPELVAAWLVLESFPLERVPWWAAEWLVAGHDGPVLCALAGLGADDPRAIRDLLPEALAEMSTPIPADRVAAASVWFRQLAGRCLMRRAGERWVAQMVEETVRQCDYDHRVLDLPLGGLYGVEDAWIGGWDPDEAGLRAIVRTACAEQVRA